MRPLGAGEAFARATARLEEAFERGEIVALPVEEMLVGAPAPRPAEPPPPPDLNMETTWISVTVWDTDGTPAEGHSCTLAAPGRGPVTSVLGEDGTASLEDIPPGICTVALPDIHARPKGRAIPEEIEARRVAGAHALTRADGRKSWHLSTGMAHELQLQRRRAEVIEIEHFHKGGAVLLPGRAPEQKAAGAPTGIAAVRSCLLHATSFPLDRIRITG